MMIKDYEPLVKTAEVSEVNNLTHMCLNVFSCQDMAKYGNERLLHIPAGSAYTRLFPNSLTQGIHKSYVRLSATNIIPTSSVMKDIWKTMESKEPYIVYDPNMDLNVDFIQKKIIDQKGLFVHTREMHA